ncbi:hypothetical protein Tco_0941932 [Tanacetum coccineum]|uniref:Uncharacterized protein n=1 Tax=Tanacetum coccineum TaxID=301880 RepID=A0ABQ5DT18_9ASTR
MESLNSNSQERVASVATNGRQSKGNLHDIFSTTSIHFSRVINKHVRCSSIRNSIGMYDINDRKYDRRVNKRLMQMQEGKAVLSKALDASLVFTECSGTKSDEHITSSGLGTYITHVVDADIRPVNDQVSSAEVHLTAQHNVLANEQQHTDQSEPSYDTYLLEKVDSNTTLDSTNMSHRGGEIDQDAEQDQVKSPLLKAEFLKTNDMVEKEVYNELSNRFLQLEKHCISLEISMQQKEETQLQAKTTLICNLKNQIKSVKEASNEAKLKKEINVLETINIELESSVAKLLAENEHLKQTYKELYDSIKKTRIQTKDHNDSLIAQVNSKTVENADLKAQIQEKVFANAALKNELRKLNGTSVDTKFAKPSILGKPVLQPHRNQSVVRQPNAFKSERPNFSKPRFASQVDVINVLSKPVTPHYLPKVQEYVLAKPHHVITIGSSRNSQEEYYGSNDMAHNHYLEEARKKTQERNRNSKPSVMPSVRLQNTANDSKHFFCSTCHKCVFNANHDACITKLLNEVNSRKVKPHKTKNSNNPVEQKSHTQKPGRQISSGHRFSPKKTSTVYEKTSPRSCLRWISTGRIFKLVGLRWIPTGKMFIDSTTKVGSEPPNGSNKDITNPYECDQTLNVSAGTLNLSAGLALQQQMAFADNTSGLAPQKKERSRTSTNDSGTINSGLVQNIPSPTPTVPPTKIDWDSLFQPMFDEYFKPPPNVDHPVPEVPTPVPAASTSLPSSTTVDQDAPSTSTSQTISEKKSLVIPQGVEDDFVPEITSVFTTTIPPPPLFFNPLLHQATPTPTPTALETTTSFLALLDFASVFKLNKRVTNLEKDLAEMKQVNQYAKALSSIPAIVDHYIDNKLGEVIQKAIQTKIRKSSKEAESSRDSRSKDTKSLSTSKDASHSQHNPSENFAHAEEPSHTVDDSGVQQNQEFETGNNDKQPADKETWISQVSRAKEPTTSFDELINTPINFSGFFLNRINIKDLTQAILVGPAFDLLKGISKSLTELEYYLKEYHRGRQIIPKDYFINNDLEYLKGGSLSRQYSTSVTKTKAATYEIKWIKDLGSKRQQFYGFTSNMTSSKDVYSKKQIITVTRLTIMKKYDYGHLEEIEVRREDQQLYKFREYERYDLNVALRMFTRRIAIQRRVEDLQLGVKSYQKKLNLTKPDTFRSNLRNRIAYTTYLDLKGVIYKDQNNRNRLIRADELHKFSDGTLNDVQTALHDIASGIRMKYLPKRKWSGLDKRRARVMI